MKLRLGGGDTLDCPVCGMNCCHLGRAWVDRMRDVVTVRGEKLTVETRNGPAERYGSTVGFRAFCESGHAFEVEFCFHKGEIWIETRHRPDQETERDGWLEELPRAK